MKLLKVVLLSVVSFILVYSFGCASKQIIKDEVVAQQTPAVSGMKYVVRKGDTLWKVSSQNKIYQDSFQWPLLYKANRDQVTDPDMIEVGQELDVKKDMTDEEKATAIQQAKETPPYKLHKTPRKSLPLKY